MKIIILFLLVLFDFCFNGICCWSSEARSMEQKQRNYLGSLHFIPQRDLLVSACGSGLPNGSIRVWSIDDGQLKEVLDLGKRVWTTTLAVSNDGSLIVVGLFGKNEIRCYSLKEKTWLWKVNWLEEGLLCSPIRFTPDDRRMVVVGARNIVTYDAKTGVILQRQEDSKFFSGGFPNYRTRREGLSPSARYAAFWQGNMEAHEGWWRSKNIWVLVRDVETGKVIAKQGMIQDKYKNWSALFTPDEKNLLLGSMDGYVRFWSITEQKVIWEWRAYRLDEFVTFRESSGSPSPIHSMIFSPDGRQLATIGGLKGGFAIRIWDYPTNKLIHEFPNVCGSIGLEMCTGYPMAFSPDGKYFAFEQQGNLCLYGTQTWQEKWCVPSWTEEIGK